MEDLDICIWLHYLNSIFKICYAKHYRDISNNCIALSRLNLLFTAVTLKNMATTAVLNV